MQGIQLYFEELDEKLYISGTCNECKELCKVYCITKDAQLHCSKYVRITVKNKS
ncbi:hypothetical protein [Romboutsia sp. 1001285H_161024_C4]|uniref:hypothetical protein n=1 Tax=Romboutsia sp. 1001285H_161024_C4 TaxID=2787109 RepID=UPI001898A01F|nr:hypothetical protein [Romboutsia sp. 1001285H_161024_C4]